MITRKFGWLPDLPDIRDILFSSIRPVKRKLPEEIDLRGFCSPIENQLSVGSCVGNSTVASLEFLEIKGKVPYVDMSRLFVYYNARARIGQENQDSGCYIRDAIKSLAKEGVCPEKDWSYDVKLVTTKPYQYCYDIAEKFRIVSYSRIQTLNEMKTCLADGFPFVFGFTVYESFMGDKVAKTGQASMPKLFERTLGGHAVLAVGYNDKTRRFLIRNSWGEDWGQKGYFTLPYAYLENRNLSDDFWCIRKGEQI